MFTLIVEIRVDPQRRRVNPAECATGLNLGNSTIG